MTEPSQTPICRDAQQAIQEALGTARLPAEVARHIENCLVCAREAGGLARLVGGLRSLPMAEPSQAFWEDLPRQVLEEIHTVERRRSWALSALAAAALLLVAIVPADRAPWSPRSAGEWLPDLAVLESWPDHLDRVRSTGEAARVVRRVAVAHDFGPRAIQRMVDATEEETIRRPETVAWNLLDTLGPRELERVLARLEKGAHQ